MADTLKDLRRQFPVYSHMLCLYPKRYRQQYGDQMLQVAADMREDVSSRRELWGLRFRLTADLPVSIITEHMQNIGEKMSSTSSKPNRKNNILTGWSIALALSPLVMFMLTRLAMFFGIPSFFFPSKLVIVLSIGSVLLVCYAIIKVKNRRARMLLAASLIVPLLFIASYVGFNVELNWQIYLR